MTFDLVKLNFLLVQLMQNQEVRNFHQIAEFVGSVKNQKELMLFLKDFFESFKKFQLKSAKTSIAKIPEILIFENEKCKISKLHECENAQKKFLFILPKIYKPFILVHFSKFLQENDSELWICCGDFARSVCQENFEAIFSYESAFKFLPNIGSGYMIFSNDEFSPQKEILSHLTFAQLPAFLVKLLYFLQNPKKFMQKYIAINDENFHDFHFYENWLCDIDFSSFETLSGSHNSLKYKEIILDHPFEFFSPGNVDLWKKMCFPQKCAFSS